jgi:hypothetical protein
VKCVACKLQVLRKDYEHHVNAACSKACKLCKEEVIRKRMKLHKQYECLEFPVKCPNEGCLVFNGKRKLLQNHKLNDCLFQPIKCPFFLTGCEVDCNGFVLRKDFPNHVNDNTIITSAFISACKKTIEIENKFLLLATTSPQSKICVSKILDVAKELDPTEEILLKKWVEFYNYYGTSNQQKIESFFEDVLFEKKRKLNNDFNKLGITNILYEFQIPKNITKKDHYSGYSPKKKLYENIYGSINFEHLVDSESFGVFLFLENYTREATFTFTLLNFSIYKNVSDTLTKSFNEVEVPQGSGAGFSNFIKFDDFKSKQSSNEENYIARFIVKIDF